MAQQRARDERDRERQHSPLRRAGDAFELDTTELSIEQVVDRIAALVPA
jgi:cytidylate kinase